MFHMKPLNVGDFNVSTRDWTWEYRTTWNENFLSRWAMGSRKCLLPCVYVGLISLILTCGSVAEEQNSKALFNHTLYSFMWNVSYLVPACVWVVVWMLQTSLCAFLTVMTVQYTVAWWCFQHGDAVRQHLEQVQAQFLLMVLTTIL